MSLVVTTLAQIRIWSLGSLRLHEAVSFGFTTASEIGAALMAGPAMDGPRRSGVMTNTFGVGIYLLLKKASRSR